MAAPVRHLAPAAIHEMVAVMAATGRAMDRAVGAIDRDLALARAAEARTAAPAPALALVPAAEIRAIPVRAEARKTAATARDWASAKVATARRIDGLWRPFEPQAPAGSAGAFPFSLHRSEHAAQACASPSLACAACSLLVSLLEFLNDLLGVLVECIAATGAADIISLAHVAHGHRPQAPGHNTLVLLR